MAYNAANIRTAITELLEGSIGSGRTVAAGTFVGDVFDWQNETATQAATLDGDNHFDVLVGPAAPHEATPLSMANTRIERLDVRIMVWRHIKTSVERTAHQAARAALESEIDTARVALAWPGNLSATAAAGATGIISGRMQGRTGTRPEVGTITEDGAAHLFRCEITGSLAVTITDS